jgi:hypothetical protein
MTRYYDGDTKEDKFRLDCLFGVAKLYAELGCVVYSGA